MDITNITTVHGIGVGVLVLAGHPDLVGELARIISGVWGRGGGGGGGGGGGAPIYWSRQLSGHQSLSSLALVNVDNSDLGEVYSRSQTCWPRMSRDMINK